MKRSLFLPAVLFLLSSAAWAPAQFGAVEYLYLNKGLTVGSNTVVASPGTLRYHPATTNLQFHDGSGWREVGSGTGLVLGDDPADEAFLAWDADAEAYVHVYGPRAALSASEAVSLHGAGALGVLLPGRLLRHDLAPDGSRHVYSLTNALDASLFATNDFSWLPLGAGDVFWEEFVRQGIRGQAGAAGAAGTDGLDGLGGFFYGPWDSDKEYVYDAEAPIVVSRAGRWYEAVASSTNRDPAAAGGTNWWTVSVSNGMDGTIVAWTNLVDRRDWWTGGDYSTNDSVWHGGNCFVVSPTNQKPPVGVAPSLGAGSVGVDSAYWHPLTLRGEKGEPGEKGADGDEINSYVVYTLMPGTNTLFSNDASATEKLPVWVSTYGGNLTMFWSRSAPLGTNWLSATNGELRLNGIAYPAASEAAESDPLWAAWATNAAPGTTNAILSDGSFADVSALLRRSPTANHDAPLAGLVDGTVTLDVSSRVWRVATGDAVATNWVFAGADTNCFTLFGVQLGVGTNMFAWPAGNTNAPEAGTEAFYFIYRLKGDSSWIVVE